MQKLLILFFIALSFNKAYSQNYIPFPDTNGVWVNTYSVVDWSAGNPMPDIVLTDVANYCVSGVDTVINSKTYSKINYCGGQYKGAVRDETGKVYFIPKDSINEFILYDFTVESGDTLNDIYIEDFYGNQAGLYDFVLGNNDVDSVLINGTYRKQIRFSGGEWIEGIGNTQGLFLEPSSNVSDYIVDLHCMSQLDTILYPSFALGSCNLNVGLKKEKYSKVLFYPNPSSDYIKIKTSQTYGNVPVQIFSFDGKLVYQGIVKTPNSDKINVEKLKTGLYLIVIHATGQTFSSKFIKR